MLATQNPYEFEGTYVLPESQLDRFMLRLRMGYPIRAEERRVVSEGVPIGWNQSRPPIIGSIFADYGRPLPVTTPHG